MIRTSFIKSIFFILVFFSSIHSLKAQNEGYDYLTGAKNTGEVDTLALETSRQILEKTQGLLEREIIADEYILGPGDVLAVSIISSVQKLFEVEVTPEGIIVAPYIGAVEVKGKTLTQARELIDKKVRRFLQADEVFTTLYKLREFKLTVNGAVRKSSMIAATAADRVSEVIERSGGLKMEASLRNIILLRKNGETEEKIHIDLMDYYRGGNKDANPTVLGGDHIIVPPKDEDLMIEIFGEVALPEKFEYVTGDSLADLFKFALGFNKTALLDSVEYTTMDESGRIRTTYLDLSSWRVLFQSGKILPNNIPIKPGDRVFVRKKTDLEKPITVCVEGEIVYPGYYAVTENAERISDLLKRAGGFTEDASMELSVFMRKKELKAEDKEMERLWRIPPSEMSEDEQRYFRARIREKKGVMAIDLRKIWEDPSVTDNVILEDEDSLFIPKKKMFVNVQGRVNNPGLVTYNPDYNYEDYIVLAGGYGYRADDGETMIVKTKGRQFSAESGNYTIEPGDYILVPPEPDTSGWEVFTSGLVVISQVMSVLGVVVALTR